MGGGKNTDSSVCGGNVIFSNSKDKSPSTVDVVSRPACPTPEDLRAPETRGVHAPHEDASPRTGSLLPQPRIPPRLLDLATLMAAQLVDDVLRKLLCVDHGQVGRLNWAV